MMRLALVLLILGMVKPAMMTKETDDLPPLNPGPVDSADYLKSTSDLQSRIDEIQKS